MTQNQEPSKKGAVDPVVITALISAIVTIITAYFTYSLGITSTELPIRATQTAEAKTPFIQVVEVPVKETVVIIETQPPVEVTLIPSTVPGNRPGFLNWQTDFCDDLCGQGSGTIASAIFTLVVPGRTHEALEVIFDLRNSGWVLIKKNITPEDLAGTNGVSFLYKGIGAPNSIELKLLLRYPGDSVDTTFGVLWNRATNTGDEWRSHEALYEVDFRCWGPANLCEQHGNTFDMESVHRIEFGIANKNGDSPGLGKVTFDELILISE